jgi:hypothetical protein
MRVATTAANTANKPSLCGVKKRFEEAEGWGSLLLVMEYPSVCV